MSNIRFTGIMPALITPFDRESGKVKRNCVKELLDYEYAAGIDGFYICGSTGEGPVLKASTRMEMSETIMEFNGSRGVIIEHIGAPSFDDAVELAKHADKIGVDAISSLAPNFYYQLNDDELVDYYKAIASVTDKPLLVYATKLISTSNLPRLIERFMEIPNVIGLKYTIYDYFMMSKIKMLCGGDINVINGPDEMLICGLSAGADGGMGSTYNIMPEMYVNLFKAFKNGDIALAREYQYKINRIIDVLIPHGNKNTIKSIKEVLKMKGFDAGACAKPAREFSKEECDSLRNELKKAGLEGI